MEIRPPQTVKEIEAIVGDDYINEVQELGNKRDKASLDIAKKALHLIEELHETSRKAVYGFYAKHTSTSTETIRKDVKMLELVPAEFWQRYEVIGVSFFRHVTHFEAERMKEAMDYALENQCTFDEFMLMYPRVEDEEADEIKTKHEYPFQFLPILRLLRNSEHFAEAKPHLDALNEICRKILPTEGSSLSESD